MDQQGGSDTLFKEKHTDEASLSTSYMGLRLASPLIAGSCPMNIDFEFTRLMVASGIGAIVLPSILQEQIVYQSMIKTNPIAAIEKSGHTPQQDRYNGGTKEYLETIERMKREYSIPIIASMHGASTGVWLDFAVEIQGSGADALELNWQIGRCDPNESGEQVEARMLEWVSQIRSRVTIPIAFKMNDRFTNPAYTAIRLQNAGVNGLILFAHRPHWDVDSDRRQWTIGWELTPIGALGKTLEGLVEINTIGLNIPLAASGGIRTGDDVVKTMITGADVAVVVSEIYRQGPNSIDAILAGVRRFLDTNHYRSIQSFVQSRSNLDDRPRYEMRSEIIDPLTSPIKYQDPSPVIEPITGDRFGHPSQ